MDGEPKESPADEEADASRLRRELSRWRGRCRYLEGLIYANFETPAVWKLSRLQSRIFGVLVQHEIASKELLLKSLYDYRETEAALPASIDVFMHRLRGKVEKFGVKIETERATGYRLLRRERFQVRYPEPLMTADELLATTEPGD